MIFALFFILYQNRGKRGNSMNNSFSREKRKRIILQSFITIIFLIIIVGGWFYPVFGYFIPACMLLGITVALFNGRLWCNWMCPRGSFYDRVANQISHQRKIPSLFRSNQFRAIIIFLLISVMIFQLWRTWPDPVAMGGAFMLLLTITTIIGIILSGIYHQRTWCYICPIGTISNWIGGHRKPIFINSKLCVECKLCGKICPMQVEPYAFKSTGVKEVKNRDCIRCGLCAAVCPEKALSKNPSEWTK